MNSAQTAMILDRIATAYRIRIDAPEMELWAEKLDGIDVGVASEALDRIIAEHTGYPPTISDFLRVVGQVHRERAVAAQQAGPDEGGPDPACSFCRGKGWGEGRPTTFGNTKTGEATKRETVRPCESCNPQRYERWRGEWQTERRRNSKIQPTDRLDYNPADVFAQARANLESAGG